MHTFDQSAVSAAPPEEVWKLLYDPTKFPLWWAGTGSVESGGDVGDYTMYPEGYPDFPMPQTLTTSRENGAVTISCLVSDLCFDWRLRPSGSGTEISVHVEIPDHEAHRLDTQREIIGRSVRQLAELAADELALVGISGNNLPMVDVPIWVAVITALAGILGAAIPQGAMVIRDVRQAERDRKERFDTATRDACVELLRAAGELRSLAEGWRRYGGDPTAVLARVAEARGLAEATRLHAVTVSMQVPGRLGPPANRLADAATALVVDVVANTDVSRGVVLGDPNVDALVTSIDAFSDAAVSFAGS